MSRLSATLTHMSEAVGIRALQQNASEVVQRAARGQTVTVTDRCRPVARLVPLTGSPIELLLAEGHVRAARRDPRDIPTPLPASSGPTLSELLAEARADER